MPERVADAIEEIARPNRDDQQEKPQIQADPALRRPRLICGMPRHRWWRFSSLSAAVAAGLAVFWALGLPRCRGGSVCRSRVSCPSALWPPPLSPSSPVVCSRGRSGPRRPCGGARAPGVPACAVAPLAFRCSDRSSRQSSSGSAWPRWRHGSSVVRSSSAPPPLAPSTWSKRRCRRSRAW